MPAYHSIISFINRSDNPIDIFNFIFLYQKREKINRKTHLKGITLVSSFRLTKQKIIESDGLLKQHSVVHQITEQTTKRKRGKRERKIELSKFVLLHGGPMHSTLQQI